MALENRQVDEVFNINSPVLDCLRYACKDHYNSPMGSLASPKMLLKEHEISSRQYQRVALKMRASLQEWNDIDHLLLSKVKKKQFPFCAQFLENQAKNREKKIAELARNSEAGGESFDRGNPEDPVREPSAFSDVGKIHQIR